jgi:pyruvate,water dikinase
MSQFEDLHRELFDPNRSGDSLTTQRLVQIADSSFLQADRALWRLSRQARTLPAVREILARLPVREVLPALGGCAEGQIFVAELRAWLHLYGLRGHGADGLSDRSWIEEPLPAIQHLQAFLQQPDSDLEVELRVQAAMRAEALEQVRQRLNARPPAVRERYTGALQAAQHATFLSIEHNFWIDQQAMVCLRRVFLELGRRRTELAQLDQAEDIFFLTVEEVQALIARSPGSGWRELVGARKAQLAQAHALNPPSFLGTVPLAEPPPEDPFVRAMMRVLGMDALGPTGRQAQRAPRELSGQPASAGVVRGAARILRSLNESDRLQPGDVLVAEATMPAWTPLFAIAAAVITDVGGMLSHAATTAREYGIPAVVGARNATSLLQDGQQVEVDGSAGIVRLIDGTN